MKMRIALYVAAISLCLPFSASAETVIEEVVVTAQKREQGLQEVPPGCDCSAIGND